LNEINARHFASSRAADNILFAVEPLNGRYPTLEESASWSVLMSHYDFDDQESSVRSERFVQLKRSHRPKFYRLIPANSATARVGESVAVPNGGGYIWSRIDVELSLIGNLHAVLYKAPALHLVVETEGGLTKAFRFLPATARSGFLLSRLVDSNDSLVRLMREMTVDQIQSIRVDSKDRRVGLFYRGAISFEFDKMVFDARDDRAAVIEAP
jgi:hypothetical protein